jgi:hypothetical protein
VAATVLIGRDHDCEDCPLNFPAGESVEPDPDEPRPGESPIE